MSSPGAPSRRPLLTSLLERPQLCGWIFGAGVVHVALAATPLGGWRCPVRDAIDWPCPGCGLGRAAVLLLNGEVRESLRLHAFAGLLLIMLATLGAGLAPGALGESVRTAVRWIEERTWLVPAALVAVLVYWIARFALDASGFRTLVV